MDRGRNILTSKERKIKLLVETISKLEHYKTQTTSKTMQETAENEINKLRTEIKKLQS